MACGLKLNFRLPDIFPCRYRKQTILSPRREILFSLWLPTPRFARLLPRLKASQPLPSPRKRATESRSLSSLPKPHARPLAVLSDELDAGRPLRASSSPHEPRRAPFMPTDRTRVRAATLSLACARVRCRKTARSPEGTAGEATVQGRLWSSTSAECDSCHVRSHEVGSTLNTTARIVRRLIWMSDPAMADNYFETSPCIRCRRSARCWFGRLHDVSG